MEETENFKEYMEYFKNQPLKEKQSIILDQLKILTSFSNSMCKELDLKNEILVDKEVLDVNKREYTEDDFAEAVVVYINSIQNSICDYVDGITEMLDNMGGE